MTQGPPQKKPIHPLVQKALARLVAICRGNGVNIKSIKVAKADVQEVAFSAGTFFELQPSSSEKTMPGRQQAGEVLHDPRDVERIAREMMDRAASNRSVEELLRNHLTTRKDKGFMLQDVKIPIKAMDRTVCWHEPCATCNHTGQVRCQQCNGQKYTPCRQCHGQTMMQCPLCRGTGNVAGNKGPQPCGKCHGMRRIPCAQCGRTGKTPCPTCRGAGLTTCQTCRGQAYSTHIVTLGLTAITRADYTRAQVPEHMTFLIESNGHAMVAAGDITVRPQAMQEANKMGVHYNASFSFADITFQIGNKPVKAEAYGQGKFVRLPTILDQMLSAPLQALTRAARGEGDVAQSLHEAGRYRAIAYTLVTTIRANATQTTQRLLKKYPEGLSQEMAIKIGKAADAAVAKITQKPRYIGLALGLVTVAALYAFYYIGPGRGMITPYIGNPIYNSVVDLCLVFIGGSLTTLAIQLSARGALHKALGHLIPADKRKRFLPRTHGASIMGYVAGTIIYLIMIEMTRHVEGGATPVWYQNALNLIGL